LAVGDRQSLSSFTPVIVDKVVAAAARVESNDEEEEGGDERSDDELLDESSSLIVLCNKEGGLEITIIGVLFELFSFLKVLIMIMQRKEKDERGKRKWSIVFAYWDGTTVGYRESLLACRDIVRPNKWPRVSKFCRAFRLLFLQ
jgi:hypothetical protein